MTDLVKAWREANAANAAKVDAMIEAFQAGAPWTVLRDTFGCSYWICQRMMIDAGAWQRGDETPYQRINREKKAVVEQRRADYRAKQAEIERIKPEALALWTSTGMTVTAVAEVFGVPRSTVDKWINVAGATRIKRAPCPVPGKRMVAVPGSQAISPTCFCANCCNVPECDDMPQERREAVEAEYQVWLAEAIARRKATNAEAERIRRYPVWGHALRPKAGGMK